MVIRDESGTVTFQLDDAEFIALHAVAYPWIVARREQNYSAGDWLASNGKFEHETELLRAHVNATAPSVHAWLSADPSVYGGYLMFWQELHTMLYCQKKRYERGEIPLQ